LAHRLIACDKTGQGGSTLNAGQTLTRHLDLYDKASMSSRMATPIRSMQSNELGVQLASDAQTNLALIVKEF
jgi:hypothetical protein